MAMAKHIRMERDGPVGIITIDRRERFNSLDVETAQDLEPAARRQREENALHLPRQAAHAVEQQLCRRHLDPGDALLAAERLPGRDRVLPARRDGHVAAGRIRVQRRARV